MYYDLKNNKFIKKDDASKGLSFLYNNLFGRIILKILTAKWVSKIGALYMNSFLSKHKIKKFIKQNNINVKEYEEKKYKSFNDFFMRKLKKNKRKIDKGLIAVCDSKLSVYEIDENLSFKIKDSIYTVNELIRDDVGKYNFKYALVFRLCVDDYHHYIYPDNGKVISSKYINGKLHTVRPIAFKKHKVFIENARNVMILDCENIGIVGYIEVGALMVGKIVNENISSFKKGDEKGHFEFGGSTIVMLVNEKCKIDDVLIQNTKKEIETIVKLGNRIGD